MSLHKVVYIERPRRVSFSLPRLQACPIDENRDIDRHPWGQVPHQRYIGAVWQRRRRRVARQKAVVENVVINIVGSHVGINGSA
jgi:hypothetical protein